MKILIFSIREGSIYFLENFEVGFFLATPAAAAPAAADTAKAEEKKKEEESESDDDMGLGKLIYLELVIWN